jgi:hypothetical protein
VTLDVILYLFGYREKITAWDVQIHNEGSTMVEHLDQVRNGGGPETDGARSVCCHWRTNEMYGASHGEMRRLNRRSGLAAECLRKLANLKGSSKSLQTKDGLQT